MKKREVLGTVEFDYSRLTADKGHEYGAGRAPRIHKQPKQKREKQRLRKELREW